MASSILLRHCTFTFLIILIIMMGKILFLFFLVVFVEGQKKVSTTAKSTDEEPRFLALPDPGEL